MGYKWTEIGVIPTNWQVALISDIAEVKTGPFGSALHESDYVEAGTPIITVEHLSEQGVEHANLPLVSDADLARLSAYRLQNGDIVFSRVGSVDRNALIRTTEDGWLLATHFDEPEETAMYKVEKFEQEVKQRFIKQPGQMKLLIVVDKLLTGFDAPSATYLYIDKQMRDHGLFQAICRVNRLDGEDKEYGYVIDYKDLFKSLETSIKNYTGEALDGYDVNDVADLLKDRLQKGKDRLEELRESVKALCEPVEPPKDTCTAAAKRIWLNLELIKKPPVCAEYILVHEMVHLLERHHNDRFRELMDTFMPNWQWHREELNRSPLAHEDWSY